MRCDILCWNVQPKSLDGRAEAWAATCPGIAAAADAAWLTGELEAPDGRSTGTTLATFCKYDTGIQTFLKFILLIQIKKKKKIEKINN